MTVLWRKHRPKTLLEIKGQSNTRVLEYSVRLNKLHPGYIFQGMYGTGKTTSARVFAQTINCENLDKQLNPCFVCNPCAAPRSYLTELDAASNRGIDKIKEIIDSAKYRPKHGKYRVIIMDEYHQLSKDAIAALLKLIEDPPKHLIMIFCTTDRLTGDTQHAEAMATLASRCIILPFNPIESDVIKAEVQHIGGKENIRLKKDTLNLIARKANGSLRDAIGLIDKLYLMQGISMLITPEEEYALKLLSVFAADVAEVIQLIIAVEKKLLEPALLWEYMIEFVRDVIFFQAGVEMLHVEDVQAQIDKLSRLKYDWITFQRRLMDAETPKTYLQLQSRLLAMRL